MISGTTLHWPALPIATGGSGVDGHVTQVELADADADGIADEAVGEVEFSGPGMPDAPVAWDLRRPADPGTCEEGASGDVMVELMAIGAMPTIAWGDAQGLPWQRGDDRAIQDRPVAGPAATSASLAGRSRRSAAGCR